MVRQLHAIYEYYGRSVDFQPLDVLEERAQRYGDTFALGKNTSTPLVYVSNPEAIQANLDG
jgi:hypothetical protein